MSSFQKKFVYTFFFALIAGNGFAHATTLTCSDVSGRLKYIKSVTVGGPCCGGSVTTLAYDGTVVKEVRVVNAGGPVQASATDSDPSLVVVEGTQTNMNNSTEDRSKNLKIDFVSMNLTLRTTDAMPVLPGGTSLTKTVSLVCELDSHLFAVP